MEHCLLASAGRSPALDHCINVLMEQGFAFSPKPTKEVTHLILPIPSVDTQGHIKGDGPLDEVLPQFSPTVTVIGGNLPDLSPHPCIDLLKDTVYVCQNAHITAHCAVTLAADRLQSTFRSCKCLIIGWGRIGKCLAHLMKSMDAQVTVAARKLEDRGMLEALGYRSVEIAHIKPQAYTVIYNTAPELLLPDCPGDALKIDLASQQGITGANVLWARGLPGKMAPIAAGEQMAQRILYYIKERME